MQEKETIFISWSGKDTASYRMANILYETLPVIFQSADYFLSDDIPKGTVGIQQIFQNLSKAKIGIICVTKQNVEKTWLNFEAGALGSAVYNKDGMAIPLLIDMTSDEFAASNTPMKTFQGTELNEKELMRMFLSINTNLGNPLKETQVKSLFDSMAKNQILNCSLDSGITSVKKSNSVQNDVLLTKDCLIFLRKLYQEYLTNRNKGLSRSESIAFGNSKELSAKFGMSFEDVEYFTRHLADIGYLHSEAADLMVFFSELTEKAVKFCEENFDDPYCNESKNRLGITEAVKN